MCVATRSGPSTGTVLLQQVNGYYTLQRTQDRMILHPQSSDDLPLPECTYARVAVARAVPSD